jgi:hypothetical protein
MEHIMHSCQIWWQGNSICHKANPFSHFEWLDESRIQLSLLAKSHYSLHWQDFQKYLVASLKSNSLLRLFAKRFCQL